MRRKTIIEGFKNSQKFRVIFKGDGSENEIGLYMTVQQMTEQFATVLARTVCWEALEQLAKERRFAENSRVGRCPPTGLGTTIRGKQVQVDLC
jgi:tartrate dehydratase alpha subunit/fumarate hydratase class I-like protein